MGVFSSSCTRLPSYTTSFSSQVLFSKLGVVSGVNVVVVGVDGVYVVGVYGTPQVLLHVSSPYCVWNIMVLQVGFIALTVACKVVIHKGIHSQSLPTLNPLPFLVFELSV